MTRRVVVAIALTALTACGLFASPGEYGAGSSDDGAADAAPSNDALVAPEAVVLPDGNVVPASAGTITLVAGERDPTSPDDNPAWSADTWSGILDATGRVTAWKVERSATLVGPFDTAGLVDGRWALVNESFGLAGARGTALQSTGWGPGVVGDWRASRAAMPDGVNDIVRVFSGPSLVTIGGTRTVAVDGGTSTFSINETFSATVDSAENSLGNFAGGESLNTSRSRAGLAVGDGFLYVVGGRAAAPSGITTSIEVAKVDATTGVPGPFTQVTTASSEGGDHRVFLPGVVVAEGYLFVAGGRVTTGNAPTDVVISAKIDPANGALGAFQNVTKLPAPVRDFAIVAHKGKLYVAGGITESGRTDVVASATIAADGTLSAWDTTHAKLPAPRSDIAVIAH
ncbi:MAG: hypothetical protein KF819_26015 [Labilithrix sp.]|nr:hypothetical protein [Labilithrix sp.]